MGIGIKLLNQEYTDINLKSKRDANKMITNFFGEDWLLD